MANAKAARQNHMTIRWHELFADADQVPASRATLNEKASLVGRIGQMMLAVGTGAWRVRDSMNTVSRALGITCSADVGLLSINFTCFEGEHHSTQSLSLQSTGINTDRLMDMEMFVEMFSEKADTYSVEHFHLILDDIQSKKANYSTLNQGLASAIACCGFTFLLGGGIIEMFCAFLGAGVGNFVKTWMARKKLTMTAYVTVGVASACLVYAAAIGILEMIFGVRESHEVGYICSMLFIIPGFPLITGGIDLAKQDMRSGVERILYALIIITISTLTGWVIATVVGLQPGDFERLGLGFVPLNLFRLAASFAGVYGFSLMYNSPRKMAATAGVVGMTANTLRLILVDTGVVPPSVAAFLCAFTAGILAVCLKRNTGFPRISLTVPSIVIMVPGLYMYRGIYNIGISSFSEGGSWIARAALMVLALPLGLIFARIVTDSNFRHCS